MGVEGSGEKPAVWSTDVAVEAWGVELHWWGVPNDCEFVAIDSLVLVLLDLSSVSSNCDGMESGLGPILSWIRGEEVQSPSWKSRWMDDDDCVGFPTTQ